MIAAAARAAGSPNSGVNSHERPLQPISGRNATHFWLKTIYQTCTRPCKMMKVPNKTRAMFNLL